ncbi:MAG: DUF1207 domain-containing protein [Planctomycetota bacterium]
MRAALILLSIALPIASLGCVVPPWFVGDTTSTGRLTWFPEGLLFPHPFADPRAPSFGSRFQFPVHEGPNTKIENTFGAEGSIFRIDRGARGTFELAYDTGVFSRFDTHESLDMDAHDFVLGFPLVWRSGPLAVKVHPWHLTSHLGDEYIEREDQERIDYARNAVALGVAYDILDAWRVYGEVDYAFKIGSLNKRWRCMGGVEWVDEVFGADRPALYAGLNMTSFQEIDWSINYNFQTGVWIRPQASHMSLRVGLEYYHGHSALTQFFQEREAYWSFGVWIHL